jgi:hypothetical protein
MISSLPVWPQRSFYYGPPGRPNRDSEAFLGDGGSASILTLPLSRIDKLSVAIAYFRGLIGALAIVFFMGTFMKFMIWITGERVDEIGILIGNISMAGLAVACAFGSLTYLLPLQTSARERAIRRNVGAVFGMAFDPAKLERSTIPFLEERLDDNIPNTTLQTLRHELTRTRLQIGISGSDESLEHSTDDLLEQIRIQDIESPIA